jgi:hypothetical protein
VFSWSNYHLEEGHSQLNSGFEIIPGIQTVAALKRLLLIAYQSLTLQQNNNKHQ